MSKINDLLVEIERLTQECDRLRAENNALRPLVSELQHKVRVADAHPHPAPSKAETNPLIRNSRLHG